MNLLSVNNVHQDISVVSSITSITKKKSHVKHSTLGGGGGERERRLSRGIGG